MGLPPDSYPATNPQKRTFVRLERDDCRRNRWRSESRDQTARAMTVGGIAGGLNHAIKQCARVRMAERKRGHPALAPEHDVRREVCGRGFYDAVAEGGEIQVLEHRLAPSEQDRRKRKVQLIDQADL